MKRNSLRYLDFAILHFDFFFFFSYQNMPELYLVMKNHVIMKCLRILSVLSWTLFLHVAIHAQLTTQEIDHLITDAMKRFNVVGVAIGIVKDDEVVLTKGYGVRSIHTQAPVDAHTNFAIASNTKAFTSAALAILVDEGKLKWTDNVVDYIPEFRMYDPYVTANFTIVDLLTHRSGLGLGAGDLMFFPDGSEFTIKDVLTCFQHFKPVSAFRTKYDYDNLLYLVAGEIIGRISGMHWEDFVKTRILDPLGMDNSYCSFQQKPDMPNVANPHSTETGPLKEIPHFEKDAKKINGAAGAILSNVDDLCNWMRLQLNKGKYGANLEKQLFSEASHRYMWRIHTVTNFSPDSRYNTHFAGYGLGWGLRDVAGKMSVTHTGGLPGMLSKTILIPDLNLGVVILTNTSMGGGPLFSAVTQTIVDSYLGLDNFQWTDKHAEQYEQMLGTADSVVTRVWQTVEAADDAHIDPADYVGIYEDKWFGKVEVSMKDGQLWFRAYRSRKLNGPMSYYQANTFAIKWEYQDMPADAFAMFSLDEEGKAQRIEMKGISPNIDFSFDFQDLDLRRVE